MMNYLMLTD